MVSLCCFITILSRQDPPLAIRLRAPFKMTFVNKRMANYASNPTKLFKSRNSHITRKQLSGTVHELVCMGRMAATRYLNLEAAPFPARFAGHWISARNTPTLCYHLTTRPFLATLYTQILDETNRLSKSTFMMTLLVPICPIHCRNPTSTNRNFC